MATEIVKTEGVALAVSPWSRTSHVVSWLTPDRGVVATLVKGAVRPKSPFLGQYDLFYRCEILFYASDRSELKPLRECSPLERFDALRGRWRETALAAYACDLARELAPAGAEAKAWFDFTVAFLARLAATDSPAADAQSLLVHLEANALKLAGLFPDFSHLDRTAEWCPFAIDLGRAGTGARTMRLSPAAAGFVERALASPPPASPIAADAVRFLGVFLAYHLDLPPERRRLTAETVSRRRGQAGV